MPYFGSLMVTLMLAATHALAQEDATTKAAPVTEQQATTGEWGAQPKESVQTLFGKREYAGGYGLFSVERGRYRDDAVLTFYGMRLGWMVTRTFGVGISTSGLATERTAPSGDDLGLDYYGVSVETTLFPRSAAHLNIVITGGEGHLSDEDPNVGKVNRRDILTFVEPEINLELNMTDWFRVLIGYRRKFVSGIDALGYDRKDLDLDSAQIGLKFGQF